MYRIQSLDRYEEPHIRFHSEQRVGIPLSLNLPASNRVLRSDPPRYKLLYVY